MNKKKVKKEVLKFNNFKMPKVKYNISIGKNEGLLISPSELLEQYFFGTMPKSKDGRDFGFDNIKKYIKTYQENLEDILSLRFIPQLVEENFPFVRRDYEEWGFIMVTFPVVKPDKLVGFISNIRQITYPSTWLTSKKSSDGKLFQRRLYIVPGGGSQSATTNSVVYSGITPMLGFMGFGHIPDYWYITYQTGFEKMPRNIIDVIAKSAAIPIFAIIGDLIFGPGVSGSNLSIDGLSQGITTNITGKNSAYGARISELSRELKSEIDNLKDVYCGIKFSVM